MQLTQFRTLLACSLLVAAATTHNAITQAAETKDAAKKPEITFKRTQLDDKFRSEGAAVGDFNHDGKMDISAGSVYYAAPDWKMVPIVAEPKVVDPKGYSTSFCNFAEDVNGDGRTDLIVVDFPGAPTWWFEQPEKAGQVWKRYVAVPVTNNESPDMRDLFGDKKRALLFAFEPGKQIGIAQKTADPTAPWKITPISAPNAPGTDKYSHGIGAGDINGDGRIDIMVKQGWWEAPADRNQSQWAFHPAPFGEDCAHMYAYDFDGDGDADVLNSAAHQQGIWWHEQTKEGWKTHEIANLFSQTHSLMLADINSDGLPDFVTGKRYWAHGPGGDIDSEKPAVMFWFELTRKDGRPVWIPHQFDDNSGVGTQFTVADVNGDGLLDVATANKKGAHYFEQVRGK